MTASSTITTGGTVATITVASGKTFDFNGQAISTAVGTGFIKAGPGTLAMGGAGAYPGGFTLNAGTVTIGGANSLGAGGALTINGGTLQGNSASARDLTGKLTSITIGGDFTFGGTAALTFDGATSLGGAVRTITDSDTATVSLNGAISGTAGNGLTKAGSGTLSLGVANTYSGDTTISAGTLLLGSSTATLGNGAGTLVLAGGTFSRGTQTTSQTLANPISLTADSVIAGNPASGSQATTFSSSSVAGSAGTLYVSNTATSGTGSLQLRFSGAFTFARPVVVGKANAGSFVYLQFYNNVATGDQTWSGLISGNGTLYKNVSSGPGGNVILSSGNTYTGGTEIRGGFFGLGTDNALGFGNVLLGYDSNPLGLFASGAARQLTNDVAADMAIVNSTNLQIKGSQNLTLAGRVLIHTSTMQFTISNTATTTFSGVVTNAGVTSAGILKTGPGKLVLSGSNTYSGTTTVGAGTLALTGTGSINTSTNLTVIGGATLDISGLSSALTLSSAQTLRGISTNSVTGTIILSGTASLTLGNTSPLVLAYTNGVPVLAITNGVLTINSNNPATITIANGGAGLPVADYKLMAANLGGSVTGSAPTNLVISGDGIAGGSASLVISNAELYLRVNPAATPPSTPVANSASSTNITAFTASWNPASGAGGYALDVSTVNNFSSYVSGFSNLNVGAVTAYAVTGLSPNTTYYYQVRATNVFGASGNSATSAVTTLVAPYVWNAGAGNWSAAGSWQYANVPGNGAAPGFSGAGGSSVNDLTGLLLSSLTFSNGAGAYVISGNALVVSNGFINNSTASETIATPLTLGAVQTFNAAAGSLTFSGPVTNAGNLLTVSATANVTNSGGLFGAGGLTKTGAGTLALSGANTFTGPTLISAGTLKAAGGAVFDDAATVALANVASATLALDNNETVGLLSGGGSTGGTLALGVNNLSVSGTTNFTGAITGTGKLIKTGAGTLTLDRATAYGPDFTLRIEGGTVDLNRAGNSLAGILGSGNHVELAGGTLQVSGGLQATLAFTNGGFDIFADSTIFFTRSASSATSHTNSSPLNFKTNATLTFGYGPNITSGTTTFDAAAHTLQGNATLALGAYGITIANPIGESGGSYALTKTGAGQLNLGAINTYSGPTTNLQGTLAVNGTSTFGNGSGTLVLAGGDILDTSTRVGAPIANPILMTANTTIYGNSSLTTGLSRLFPLSSSSITTVGGTLTIRNINTVGTNEFLLLLTGGGFNFTQPIVIGSVNDSNSLTSALQLYNDTNTAAQTFSGNLSGVGRVLKSAAISGSGGVSILTGSNSYAGTTTASEGTLLVNNTTGSGTGTNTVFVTSGGTLGGTGVILGSVTNSFGSTLQPGFGGTNTATLTISNSLGLAGNSLFVLNRTNAQNAAKISGLTTVRYGGTLTLTNVGDALLAGDTFTLFSAAAYTGGFTNFVLPSLTSGLVWNANTLAVNGTITVAQSPTALALTSSLNPAGYLAALNFTATLAPTTATGNVIFATTNGTFSTNALTAGVATSASVSTLPRGTNLLTAIYSGDLTYLPSTNTLLQIVTNHPPAVTGATYSRNGLNTWKIYVTNLLATASDVDGDSLTLAPIGVSTNGVTLSVSGGYVMYANASLVDDQFSYSVTDGFGGTNTALITLTAGSSPPLLISNFSVDGGIATLNLSGIPGYSYNVQVSSNLVDWSSVLTTNAPGNGQFQFIDSNPPQPSAFYRLLWNGN